MKYPLPCYCNEDTPDYMLCIACYLRIKEINRETNEK